MTTHQVNYQGPPELAVRTATLLADAEGVELTSAGQPELLDGSGGTVRMVLVIEGATEAVTAAVMLVGNGLPADASVAVEPPQDGS